MIIGNKYTFAIQFDVNPELDNWLFGHLCFIVNQIEIGNYSDETSLSTALGALRDLLWFEGIRNEPELFGLDKTELFWKIDNALYGDTDLSIEKCYENWEIFGKFEVLKGTEIFDNWKGYLIEHNEKGRLIIKNEQQKEVNEYFIKAGELDSVIKELVNFFEQNYSQFLFSRGSE